MSSLTTPSLSRRADELFEAHRAHIFKRTDRQFATLMIFQFIGGVIAALVISPRTWSGSMSQVHLHVWAALVLGGLITSLPVTLTFLLPGRLVTRCVIAGGQMLTSALLIHLTGGRIETHFHVFGSLAVLAFYRDWRVFIPATLVVGLDHLIRGYYWPESVYGVLTASPYRSLEHAAWVVFEEAFLIRACFQSIREMRDIAEKRAQLENTNALIEEEVRQRTSELVRQTAVLEQEVRERQRAEAEREDMHRRLLEASRHAGMAEIATGVLHNVGNVLNSVNVAAGLVAAKVRQSDPQDLIKIAERMRSPEDSAPSEAPSDRTKLIAQYLAQVGTHMIGEQSAILEELASLTTNIEHIKDIVAMQQSYSRVSGVTEPVRLADLVEDAIRINSAALQRHGARLIRCFEEIPPVVVDKQKVLQVLVNLIQNAKYALAECGQVDRTIALRIGPAPGQEDRVIIEVSDNGVGIPAENMTRVFAHGFTTRKDGHGYGLHTSSLACAEMGGSLTVRSEGPGKGATFTVELPLAHVEAIS